VLKKQNHVDSESVFSAIDLVPTLLTLTGTSFPEGKTFDGESLVGTLLGEGGSRGAPIFFRRPPDRDTFYDIADLPDLAVRSGKWKFLCEYDGSQPELYDIASDLGESKNVAGEHPKVVTRLTKSLLEWHQSMPTDNGATYVDKRKKMRKAKGKK
jgi:uncharacterized sulfatase